MDMYKTAAEKMLRFESIISIPTQEDHIAVQKKIIHADPRCLYYFGSSSCRASSRGLEYHMRYRNMDFPKEQVFVPTDTQLEGILYNAMAMRKTQLVFVVPAGGNFSWKIDCFVRKTMSSYPKDRKSVV